MTERGKWKDPSPRLCIRLRKLLILLTAVIQRRHPGIIRGDKNQILSEERSLQKQFVLVVRTFTLHNANVGGALNLIRKQSCLDLRFLKELSFVRGHLYGVQIVHSEL